MECMIGRSRYVLLIPSAALHPGIWVGQNTSFHHYLITKEHTVLFLKQKAILLLVLYQTIGSFL